MSPKNLLDTLSFQKLSVPIDLPIHLHGSELAHFNTLYLSYVTRHLGVNEPYLQQISAGRVSLL